jgi:hypothetical protein
MGATRFTGYFDTGCAKAGTELRQIRDRPARRKDHRRPAIRDRRNEPLLQQETPSLTLTFTYERETNDALLSDSRTPDRLCGVRPCPNGGPRLLRRPDLEYGLGHRSCGKQTPRLHSSTR